jgi:predicted O-linked N-acetylglucosamine transferase (SPINDLY family)
VAWGPISQAPHRAQFPEVRFAGENGDLSGDEESAGNGASEFGSDEALAADLAGLEALRGESAAGLAESLASKFFEPPSLAGDKRLRVGFLSAEIGDHVVCSFLSSFLAHYDRDRFAVELFCSVRRYNASASWMVEQVDHPWLLQSMDVGEARALIQSRRLDILVETTGFTSDSAIELLAERCARIQCHYIGYHATTGLDTMDWFIGDAETVPESFASQYVEGLWRLPRPWLARTPSPHLPEAVSLQSDGPAVLGSFNQLAKIREETLTHWAAALLAVPDSRLLIKDRSTADPENCDRIITALSRLGVEPERISFLAFLGSQADHLSQYNLLDVALDATPWSSATTAFDALEMGVPLVAIRGGCTSSRMSSAILRGLGRPEWIAESPDQFAAIVVDLCADLQALRKGKQQLRQQVQASPLFDPLDLTRALEESFTAMVAASQRTK